MKKVSLSGSLRENVGKKDAKKERRNGNVPCVLYGGKEQVHFSVDAFNFGKIVFTPETFLVELNIDGKVHQALLQDVQYHPVSDSALHADFLEVVEGKTIVSALPVKIVGNSPGVIAGGKLQQKIRKLKVKGLIENLPEEIKVDISTLKIGDSIKVKAVQPENIQLLDTPNSVVVMVKAGRGAAVVAAEDEAVAEAAE
ncbi:MAG: 50S ribosomal protein L25/general stress protein Ctc [Bacteroidetes bacterium]|nr:50S ribosomal protein L25/general stress protein Ctc [Bacteroidota bacterium]